MAPKHKYADASLAATTSLGPDRIAQLCEVAAKRAETLGALVRLEDAQQGKLVYSVRNRIVGGRVEFLTFQVTLSSSGNGSREVRSRLLTYKVKRQWVLVVPLPWQMLGWGIYKSFMYGLESEIHAADLSARTKITERATSGR